MREKPTGEVIGDCGLIPRDSEGPEIELGYRLARRRWGCGFATEAAAAWFRLGFGRLNLDRIIAVALGEHHASRRVIEKISMTFESTEGNDVIYATTCPR